MGRPLNKRLFGADQFNNLKCQFNAGAGSVRGYIVKQLGTRTFLCEDESGNTAICRMVVKASADIAPGKMTFDTRDGDQVQYNQAVWHEKLLPGAYRVGFSADQDNTNDRATLYNLNVLVNGSTLYTYGS